MNKTTLIVAVALACTGLAAHDASAAHRAPAKRAAKQRVIDETADEAGVKVARPGATMSAANGFSVVDRPYEAPLPISPVVRASAPGAAAPFPVKPAGAAHVAVQAFRVEPSDGTLSRALRRWGREAKYPVIWEATRDLPAVAGIYSGDFPTAVNQVMEDSSTGGYPLHACLYDNVVRILHTSQSCTR